MVTALLTTLGAALAFLVMTETLMSANYRTASETLYVANAGVDLAMADLRGLPEWSAVLAAPPGNAISGFHDGAQVPAAPDGTPLDLGRLTTTRQAQSDSRYGAAGSNPDSPSWRLFAHADVSRLLPSGSIATPAYLIVWIADDVEDGDGDPSRDANGALMIRAEAFGIAGARRTVDAIVVRPHLAAEGVTTTAIRLASWREVR